MIKYSFAEGAILTFKNAKKASPQKIGETLSRLGVENDGKLETEKVVAEAKSVGSPIHKHFEWSDKVAAHAHRLEQARSLIRSIMIFRDDRPEPVIAWRSITDAGKTAYRSAGDILTSERLQLALLKSAVRDLEAWENRYNQLVDFCEMVRVAREKLHERVAKMEAENRPDA